MTYENVTPRPLSQVKGSIMRVMRPLSDMMNGLMINEINQIIPAGFTRIGYLKS